MVTAPRAWCSVVVPPRVPANIAKVYVDLPLQNYAVWDSVGVINQTLLDHDNGLFRSSALMSDAMMRDDRIQGVMNTRINSLLGLPLTFESNDNKRAQKYADEIEPLWPDIFPPDQLAALLRWGLQLGVGVGEIIWDDWKKPKLKVWHPQYLYWDWSTRQFYIATQSDSVIPITPGDGKWILYTPYGYQYGWIQGCLRALAQPWIIRKFTYRDWARYCEVHGLPIRKAISPMDAKEEHKARFAREAAAIGSETVFKLDQKGKDGPNFDLQLLEAQANTYEGFLELLKQVDDSIAITLLGQNLTTKTDGGSYAAANVQDRVRNDLLKADSSLLGDCLRHQVLPWWVRFNFDFNAKDEDIPTPRWRTDPPEDKQAKAVALFNLAQAISTFRNAGVTVDVREQLTQFDVPVLGTGVDGGFVLPSQQPKAPVVVAPGVDPRAAGKDGGKPMPKKLARSDGWRQGQDFADGLASSAKQAGIEALQPDLSAVLAIIRQSKSPDELKKKLLEAYGKMDVVALGKVLHKAALLSRMDGRWSVAEDL